LIHKRNITKDRVIVFAHFISYKNILFCKMDSGSRSGGVLLNSGKGNFSGAGSGGSTSGAVMEQGVSFYLGPNGSSRRNWRFSISSMASDTNALLVEYQKDGTWQTSQVFLAK
jgi:hypothetical protein